MMTHIRTLAGMTSVSGQLCVQDIQAAAADGVRLIINNRPDGESPDQPSSASLAEAAGAAGIDYLHAPVSGYPGDTAIEAVSAALARDVRMHLFCKSGMRSAVVWALAANRTGAMDRDQIVAAAREAGYDLSGLTLDA